jgi:hypothetical protein
LAASDLLSQRSLRQGVRNNTATSTENLTPQHAGKKQWKPVTRKHSEDNLSFKSLSLAQIFISNVEENV